MSLVSVICSQYPLNLADPKTRSSVESVLNSHYKNLELIAWRPESQESLGDWDDTRVRWLTPQDIRLGAAAALNEAVRQSHGDFIAWIEPGDIWSPDKLSQQVAALESAISEVAISPTVPSPVLGFPPIPLPNSTHPCLIIYVSITFGRRYRILSFDGKLSAASEASMNQDRFWEGGTSGFA